ncbi:MAG TPA: ABC transporter substrate-binding protein [Leucothrix mucor]|uniref:ABC transporter substrate-binding protein n=1 Tax=Leucothrix mucor TaxID=45248 RepID=A0A7V2T3Q6_LEUMU|nr:ABC transporter substrate-binding protein [Leucothrix mucor]
MTIMKQLISLIILFFTLSLSQIGMARNSVAEAAVLKANNAIFAELEKRKSELKNNPAVLNAIVKKQVLPFIDFAAMAKLTLGKHWKKANKSQKDRFLKAYSAMLINSYAKNIVDYAGATMTVKTSMSAGREGYETVRTLITPKGRAAVAANYDVRDKSGSWKAYNIEILGLNLITNFRTSFTREVSSKGLDALIARLEKNNKS